MPQVPAGVDPLLLDAFREAVRAKIARDLDNERACSEERRRRVLPQLAHGLAAARSEGLCGAAWLFGSYAWGSPSERSDVDLLVEGCSDPALVAVIVGRATGTDVHVIDTTDAPETLVRRAREEGIRM